jgi:hypothetical protein
MQIFISFYCLSVFTETPKSMRRGRGRYIVATFVITALSTLVTSLNAANTFQWLFQSTSGRHWEELGAANVYAWNALLSNTAVAVVIWIGDALLVSIFALFS